MRPLQICILVLALSAIPAASRQTPQTGYPALLALWTEFQAFEKPPIVAGAPDYTAATFTRRAAGLKAFSDRLTALDSRGWTREQQVDHALVRAELNAMDFNIR